MACRLKVSISPTANLGTRSNIPKMIKSLTEREIIESNEDGTFIADPLFKLWFKREMM